ncbi:hypothetical protein CP970_05895 [Streptomyces kanamyceticus]|uniref:ATP/GTP-binding protein n=2 Tax=Streptomyces kanamyceticus TaxID=1967 RepID=A0A5J6GB63_STRKN|nr:hypothetical protein CP970_05895 [Streptomyces kanamyceticus]
MAWMDGHVGPVAEDSTYAASAEQYGLHGMVLGGYRAGAGAFVQSVTLQLWGQRSESFGILSTDAGSLKLFAPGDTWPTEEWDRWAEGSVGAVIVANTQHLEDCFAALRYVETRGIQHVVAVPHVAGAPTYEEEDIRSALGVPATVPLTRFSTQEKATVGNTLIVLVEHHLRRLRAQHPDVLEELRTFLDSMERESLLQ